MSDLVAVCSWQAHYSFDKAARLIGLDVATQVIKVATDLNGRVDHVALEQSMEEAKRLGKYVFFCHLTSGTTVMGAFDDLVSSVKVCKRFDSFVHVVKNDKTRDLFIERPFFYVF